jgi:glutamate carboxypeptidase
MDPISILDYYRRRETEMVDSIRELVDIESPSFNVSQSEIVVGRLEEMFRDTKVDLSVERRPAEGVGQHLIIRAFPDERRATLFLGHTDTVHPIGTFDKNPTRIEGDKFYGCGIFDMKANIVLMIEMLRYFAASGATPSGPINIVLSCDEEVGSATGRPIIEAEAREASRCFVFEPSFEGRVKTGRKGTGMFTLKAHGRPAHAGLEPEKGASAILEISRQIEKIHLLNDTENGTTVNVCTISGGTTTNVIPEHAEASVDVRFTKQSEADRVQKAINDLEPFDPRVTVETLGGVNRPPMERNAGVKTLYEKASRVASSIGYELGETQVGGASDGNFVAALGIPVLDGLGITGDGAHTLHEHILVSDIAKRATLVTLLMLAD